MSYLVARIDHALTRGINWLTTSLVERARGFASTEAGDFLATPGPNIHGYRLDYPESPLVEREAEEEVSEPRSLVDQLAAQAPFFASSTDDERRRLLTHFGLDPDSAAAPFDWKVGDKYCGQCGANITAISFHACPARGDIYQVMRAFTQTPAASAGRGESSSSEVSAGPPTTAPSEERAECACWPVDDPWTYYGIVEPGGAMEFNPDCPEHGGPSPTPGEFAAVAVREVLAGSLSTGRGHLSIEDARTADWDSDDWHDWRETVAAEVSRRIDAAIASQAPQ